MKIKRRLDQLVQNRYPEFSRKQIQDMIMQGNVTVDDKVVTKAGTQIEENDDIIIVMNAQLPKYVSRAGLKLEKALDEFGITVHGLTIMDAGLSTGGFADCLLQRGVKKIYGIDVGHGQLHEKLQHEPRLVVYEKTNLRDLQTLPEDVDLVTLDLSFISVLKVLDAVKRVLKKDGRMIVLIKPQFEAGKLEAASGGIIKNEKLRQAVIESVIEGIVSAGFIYKAGVESPILGTEGNKEFLTYFVRKPDQE